MRFNEFFCRFLSVFPVVFGLLLGGGGIAAADLLHLLVGGGAEADAGQQFLRARHHLVEHTAPPQFVYKLHMVCVYCLFWGLDFLELLDSLEFLDFLELILNVVIARADAGVYSFALGILQGLEGTINVFLLGSRQGTDGGPGHGF